MVDSGIKKIASPTRDEERNGFHSETREKTYKEYLRVGLHSSEVAFLLLAQQPRVQFPAFPKKLSGFFKSLGFIDGAA